MSNLFILPTFLGDMILTTGAIEALKDEPATIISGPVTAPLFEDLPHLERLIVIKKKPWKGHWLDMWKETHKTSWNNVVDFKSSSFAWSLKANNRYRWTHTTAEVHKVFQITNFLKSQKTLAPTLWFSEERLARVKPERPVFAVAPVPGWKGKMWPIENFVTLCTTFCKTYPEAQVAVFCAPNEKPLVQPLLDALPNDQCIDTIGGHLLDSSALIKSSRLFIGNDSGLMHLSAAVKTPTIALFGPSNEDIYGPWTDQTPSPHRTLRGSPFTGNVKQVKETTNCYMTDLMVPPVWDLVQERWEALSK